MKWLGGRRAKKREWDCVCPRPCTLVHIRDKVKCAVVSKSASYELGTVSVVPKISQQVGFQ